MKRLLITGAAGSVGRVMRKKLARIADIVRVSDLTDMGELGDNEEAVQCNLADADAVMGLVEGCDAIVHLGGISSEDRFSSIVDGNIVGLFNLYEAARAHGMPRIVFASSNHVVGYYRQDERLDAAAPLKPDSLYGVSKCFGEALASMYHSKFGQETAIVRIGSCQEKPLNRRMLSTWISHDDLAALCERAFDAPMLGCPVIWGMSDNATRWWDNSAASYLGWTPKDKSEYFRPQIEAESPPPAPDAPIAVYQGGDFTAWPIVPETDRKP